MRRSDPTLIPLLATVVGIALFSAMDAVLKSAAIAIGAYSAYFLRCLVGFLLIAPAWWWRVRRWPGRAALKLHFVRGAVMALMGLSFFYALVRLPLAEAIAITFVAPLIALYLAALLLKEVIRPTAIVAALIGLAGVLVIVGGRIGRECMTEDAALGLAAVLLSALFYAWNLVLQRQQALVASPVEVGTFQNGIVALLLGVAAPFLLVLPEPYVFGEIAVGAVLAVAAAMVLSWAYGRAETQVLVPIEYTGFLWAALFGWLYFGESVPPTTVFGAALIVAGCWIGSLRRPEQSAI